MKKCVHGLSLIATLALVSGPTYAVGTWGGNSGNKDWLDSHVCERAPKNPHCVDSAPAPDPHAVPEIDASNAGLALALIGGLLAIRRERRNRR